MALKRLSDEQLKANEKARSRRYYEANKEKCFERAKKHLKGITADGVSRSREYTLRTRYGITQSQYNEIVEKQESKCAICSKERKLYVDHCHETNKIRGLLCHQCNTSLGLLQDNTEILQSAIDYLKREKE